MARSRVGQARRVRAGRRRRHARAQRAGTRHRAAWRAPRRRVARCALACAVPRTGARARSGQHPRTRRRYRPGDGAGTHRCTSRVRCGLGGTVYHHPHAAQAARQGRRPGRRARRACADRCANSTARCTCRAPAHGAAGAPAAGRVRCLQTRPRPGRHGRPGTLRPRAAAQRHARRLGARAARCAHPPRADRRVSGHQPAAMARAACVAGRLCRRGRRRQRPAAAGRVHRR